MSTQSILEVVPSLGPDYTVILLSSFVDQTWVFENPEKSHELNVVATKRVIDEVMDLEARLIFMSSVEVFDGTSGNYNEKSMPAPLNLYGHMKFEIVQYLEQKKGRSCVVRTGWNVGWNATHRCVISLTYETLLKPDAKMANDNTFSISDVQDTAKGLLRIGDHEAVRICHLASQPHIIRNNLAALIKIGSEEGIALPGLFKNAKDFLT